MQRMLGLLLLLVSTITHAESGFWTASAQAPMGKVYPAVHSALQANNFWVVYEADLGKFMADNQAKWGEDYNRNGLENVQSMVFCNINWTNRMANAHPDMLGICPLSISLYEKNGTTTVTLPRPTTLAKGSPGGEAAMKAAEELEMTLTGVIGEALKKAE